VEEISCFTDHQLAALHRIAVYIALISHNIMPENIGTGSFRYHIAVDFGTHGSGFAYSAAADGDAAAKTFEYWEGQRGSPAPKTRTALLYKLSNLTKPIAWGWEAINQYADLPEIERKSFALLEQFKLYLMPDDFDNLPQLPAGVSIRKLVGDFLACLVSTINSTLDAGYGSRYISGNSSGYLPPTSGQL